MKQQELNEWTTVKEQIDRSKIKRISWQKIFGDSLSKICAGSYAQGNTAQKTYEILRDELILMGYKDQTYFKNLKIGICSRYAEIKSHSKKINEMRR